MFVTDSLFAFHILSGLLGTSARNLLICGWSATHIQSDIKRLSVNCFFFMFIIIYFIIVLRVIDFFSFVPPSF